MGMTGAVIVLYALDVQSWWYFAVGTSTQVQALLWAIYEK